MGETHPERISAMKKPANTAGQLKSEDGRPEIDIPTLIAISALAWVLVNVSHEIIGHAGAAVLLGIPVRAVSTTTAAIDSEQVTSIGVYRTIMAAGTVMNLVAGAVALILLHLMRQAKSAPRYFLWLFSTFSFIIAAMNLVSLMFIGAGDWTEFIRELEPRGLWTAIIIGVGVILAVLGYILPLKLWMPEIREHRRTRVAITVIPVVTMVIIQSFSLIGSSFVRGSFGAAHLLACVFAYLHFALWAILVNALPAPRSTNSLQSICLPRSFGWLAAGLVIALFYFVVLGPGIGSA